MSNLRRCFVEKRLAADKVAALKAVGVEFNGLKAQAIRACAREQAEGKGKETEDEFEAKLEELKEYERWHGAILRRVYPARMLDAPPRPCATLSGSLPRLAAWLLCSEAVC